MYILNFRYSKKSLHLHFGCCSTLIILFFTFPLHPNMAGATCGKFFNSFHTVLQVVVIIGVVFKLMGVGKLLFIVVLSSLRLFLYGGL